jgi:hypothetical protein
LRRKVARGNLSIHCVDAEEDGNQQPLDVVFDLAKCHAFDPQTEDAIN